MILSFRGTTPRIAEDVFIAPTAVIIGDVTIGSGASIWYGTVLRGDVEPIIIGANTNIQDNCTVHTDPGFPATIGAGVTVGHQAVIHGCRLADNCLIGIGALVLSGSVVESEAVVAAGAVVREGQRIGPRELVAGIPAVRKRILDERALKSFAKPRVNYRELWPYHRDETEDFPWRE